MKKAHVFVEGQPEQSVEAIAERPFAGVAEPEFSLQSAFNILFSDVIPATIFKFEMKGGWKAAFKNFLIENIVIAVQRPCC